MSLFQAPTGTRDVLAPESGRIERLVATFADLAHRSGYGLLISPMFEDVGVFRRGVGEASEVVTKEMYEFEDKGGRLLALRPEGTASVVRAYLEHRPPVPYKAWYVTPAFRYERPQAGRYRQHHQLGVEALGTDDPYLDVEVIALLSSYLEAVGLSALELKVNSMGDSTCVPPYTELLRAYLASRHDELCDEHQNTFEKNPLRVLDCKRPACQKVRIDAPRLSEHLCEPCATHFGTVLEGLAALSIDYVRDDYLVRGLDYYTRTTFEFADLAMDAAQNAVGGGGRYDGLAELLGGPHTPGIGFATGIERTLLALEAEGGELDPPEPLAVYVIDLVGGHKALELTQRLRRAGYSADRAFDARSLRAQLRQADRSGARYCVIIGEAELAAKTVTLKALRNGADGLQEQIGEDDLLRRLGELVAS